MIPDQGSGGSDLDGAGVKASQGSSVITHQAVPEASAKASWVERVRQALDRSRDGKRHVADVTVDKPAFEVRNEKNQFIADCHSMYWTASVIADLDPERVSRLLDVLEAAQRLHEMRGWRDYDSNIDELIVRLQTLGEAVEALDD